MLTLCKWSKLYSATSPQQNAKEGLVYLIFNFYLTKQVPRLHLCCSRDEFVLNMFQTCFYCKHILNQYLYMVTGLHAFNGIKILP